MSSVIALYVASGIVYVAKIVLLGEPALSVLISIFMLPVGLPTFALLYKYTHVNLLFVGVNDWDFIY